MEWDSPDACAWALIASEDSAFGDVDSVRVVEVDFVFVVHGCVVGIGEFAATK